MVRRKSSKLTRDRRSIVMVEQMIDVFRVKKHGSKAGSKKFADE